MSPMLHETRMGQKLIQQDIPKLIGALEDISEKTDLTKVVDALERIVWELNQVNNKLEYMEYIELSLAKLVEGKR